MAGSTQKCDLTWIDQLPEGHYTLIHVELIKFEKATQNNSRCKIFVNLDPHHGRKADLYELQKVIPNHQRNSQYDSE